jgi:hypothetical protein
MGKSSRLILVTPTPLTPANEALVASLGLEVLVDADAKPQHLYIVDETVVMAEDELPEHPTQRQGGKEGVHT